MSPLPHLDRLSALLAGLAPRVALDPAPKPRERWVMAASGTPFLHLHVLAAGEIELQAASTACTRWRAPAILVCRSDQSHQLLAPAAGDFPQVLCARVYFDGPLAALLWDELAEPQGVALDAPAGTLAPLIDLLAQELAMPRCGQPTLLARAGDILFIGLLRHLIAHPGGRLGLLGGLAEPRLARALVAMHGQPQWPWTLESLAAEAGMSRTAFANTFRQLMRQTPGKYLAQLRLATARRIVQQGLGLKQAAQAAGYRNASALSRALSRSAPTSGEAALG